MFQKRADAGGGNLVERYFSVTAVAAGPPAPRSQRPLTVFIQHRAPSHHLFLERQQRASSQESYLEAAVLRYQPSAKVKEAGGGCLCGERL